MARVVLGSMMYTLQAACATCRDCSGPERLRATSAAPRNSRVVLALSRVNPKASSGINRGG